MSCPSIRAKRRGRCGTIDVAGWLTPFSDAVSAVARHPFVDAVDDTGYLTCVQSRTDEIRESMGDVEVDLDEVEAGF